MLHKSLTSNSTSLTKQVSQILSISEAFCNDKGSIHKILITFDKIILNAVQQLFLHYYMFYIIIFWFGHTQRGFVKAAI
jgi:hypothetical protein